MVLPNLGLPLFRILDSEGAMVF